MTEHDTPTGLRKALNERLDIDFALKAAGLGVWELDPITNVVHWDDRCRELFGLTKDNTLSYEQAIQYIHPDDRHRVDEAVRWAMNPQSDGGYDITYRTIGADDGLLRWVRFIGRSYFTESGDVYRFAGIAQDVTEDVETQQIRASEERFRSLIQEAPVAIAIFRGPNHVIEVANEAHLQLWGRRAEQVLGKPLFEALPEAKGQVYEEWLTNVLTTGEPFHAHELSAPLVRNGRLETVYFNFVYQPLRDADGTITAVTVVANDITEQVIARQRIEENEAKFRTLVEEAPVATCLFVGPDMVIEFANELMIRFFGKGRSILNKPVRAVLTADNEQSAVALLDRVFTTGEPFVATGAPSERTINGVTGTYYFDLSLKPLRDAAGAVYAILETAVDVTEQVLAHQKLEASEDALANAVELAELGTWSVDVATAVTTLSPRLADWFGFYSLTADANAFITRIGESDRERVRTHLFGTLLPGTDGLYDEVYSIIHAQTGRQRIVHATGRVRVDAEGQPVKIEGTVQDVTLQRKLQMQLEAEVQQRTEELAALNEELAATNEELMASNEELMTSHQATIAANERLSESNHNLTRSNSNLQQFAYVASHDLQEPLRKIQSFGDLLKTQYAEQLGEGVDHLQRMQTAAGRMSVLIKDLLTFSRISTQQNTTELVSLPRVVANALNDLDLATSEVGAQVDVEPLPTVSGDASQLGQLFQNLLSNALKFRRLDTSPVIRISCHRVAFTGLPLTVRPTRAADAYYRIDVSDNGIGFDDKYVDRIFQVFQRLHGRNQYAGTGIGLAICEKVAANHGGAIAATSQPGQGATFSVYLPV